MINKFASRCGIYCLKCKYREAMNCKGCQQMNGDMYWGECRLAKCSISKGLENCSFCDEFPCALLNEFSYNKEQGDNGRRIENLKAWKEQGFENWEKARKK